MAKENLRSKLLLRGMPKYKIDFFLIDDSLPKFMYKARLKKEAIKKFGKNIEVSFVPKGDIIITSTGPLNRTVYFILKDGKLDSVELENISEKMFNISNI